MRQTRLHLIEMPDETGAEEREVRGPWRAGASIRSRGGQASEACPSNSDIRRFQTHGGSKFFRGINAEFRPEFANKKCEGVRADHGGEAGAR